MLEDVLQLCCGAVVVVKWEGRHVVLLYGGGSPTSRTTAFKDAVEGTRATVRIMVMLGE